MSSDFWTSDRGILIRLEDLAWALNTEVYNNAIQVHVKANPGLPVVEFEFVTAGDDKVCADCDSFSGRRYRVGQFMPRLPRHGGCRCFWDLRLKED